jgi:DNA-binding transcriptional LysR family regulator
MPRALTGDWFLRSRLKLRHLRLMAALDERRNLHRAAEAMNIPQPAASKLLAEIEAIIGHPLFDRHPRGLTPNAQGEIMIRNAKIALRTLAQAGEEITALSHGHSGIVTVGTVMAPMVELLAEAIDTVRAKHPRLQISVDLDVSDSLAEKLLARRIDFSLARIPRGMEPSQFAYREFWGEAVHLLCREGHPLATQDRTTLAEVAKFPWVLQPNGAPLRFALERAFLAAGESLPENVVNSSSAVMAMIMVDRSDSITAMEWHVARLLSGMGRFRVLQLPEQLWVEPYGMLRLADQPLSPGAATLYDAILAIAARRNGPEKPVDMAAQ